MPGRYRDKDKERARAEELLRIGTGGGNDVPGKLIPSTQNLRWDHVTVGELSSDEPAYAFATRARDFADGTYGYKGDDSLFFMSRHQLEAFEHQGWIDHEKQTIDREAIRDYLGIPPGNKMDCVVELRPPEGQRLAVMGTETGPIRWDPSNRPTASADGVQQRGGGTQISPDLETRGQLRAEELKSNPDAPVGKLPIAEVKGHQYNFDRYADVSGTPATEEQRQAVRAEYERLRSEAQQRVDRIMAGDWPPNDKGGDSGPPGAPSGIDPPPPPPPPPPAGPGLSGPDDTPERQESADVRQQWDAAAIEVTNRADPPHLERRGGGDTQAGSIDSEPAPSFGSESPDDDEDAQDPPDWNRGPKETELAAPADEREPPVEADVAEVDVSPPPAPTGIDSPPAPDDSQDAVPAPESHEASFAEAAEEVTGRKASASAQELGAQPNLDDPGGAAVPPVDSGREPEPAASSIDAAQETAPQEANEPEPPPVTVEPAVEAEVANIDASASPPSTGVESPSTPDDSNDAVPAPASQEVSFAEAAEEVTGRKLTASSQEPGPRPDLNDPEGAAEPPVDAGIEAEPAANSTDATRETALQGANAPEPPPVAGDSAVEADVADTYASASPAPTGAEPPPPTVDPHDAAPAPASQEASFENAAEEVTGREAPAAVQPPVPQPAPAAPGAAATPLVDAGNEPAATEVTATEPTAPSNAAPLETTPKPPNAPGLPPDTVEPATGSELTADFENDFASSFAGAQGIAGQDLPGELPPGFDPSDPATAAEQSGNEQASSFGEVAGDVLQPGPSSAQLPPGFDDSGREPSAGTPGAMEPAAGLDGPREGERTALDEPAAAGMPPGFNDQATEPSENPSPAKMPRSFDETADEITSPQYVAPERPAEPAPEAGPSFEP